ncbi:hypothetical protein PSCICE_30320 [Pseudomonas cichorii]|nr:hypothetical protein PSCICE_30320 [Pseudomonas cichorii]
MSDRAKNSLQLIPVRAASSIAAVNAWRFACIHDLPIKESERKFHWPIGRRPDDHPGLSELGV